MSCLLVVIGTALLFWLCYWIVEQDGDEFTHEGFHLP